MEARGGEWRPTELQELKPYSREARRPCGQQMEVASNDCEEAERGRGLGGLDTEIGVGGLCFVLMGLTS